MTDAKVMNPTAGVGRLGTTAAWISAAACLPYLFLKVLWALDQPVGVADHSQLHNRESVAGNAVMAVVQLVAVGLVLALVRPWGRRVPTWLLLFPVWVGTGLLFQVVIGSAILALSSTASQESSADFGGIVPWVYVVVYASFAVQGVALATAFACHVRARWGPMLGERTGDVLAPPAAGGGGSWLSRHLAELAEIVAAMALVVGVVFIYWAAGGSIGLSEARPHDNAGMQASRAAGAGVAAAGLLAVAGRWGREGRFWLPSALIWVGSGALVAFDMLTVVLNRLFLMFGTTLPEADWAPIDTVLVLKGMIGVLAAVLGVLAVTAAPRHHREPAEYPAERHTSAEPPQAPKESGEVGSTHDATGRARELRSRRASVTSPAVGAGE
jgi:hypothetical protein